MKTILKFSLSVMAFACFNLVNAQPPDDPGGDPCPGWPICDSVTVSEEALKSDNSSVSINNDRLVLSDDEGFPGKNQLPKLSPCHLTAIFDQEEI